MKIEEFSVICIDNYDTNLKLNKFYIIKLYSPKDKLCVVYDLNYRPLGTFQKEKFKTINKFRNNRIKKLINGEN